MLWCYDKLFSTDGQSNIWMSLNVGAICTKAHCVYTWYRKMQLKLGEHVFTWPGLTHLLILSSLYALLCGCFHRLITLVWCVQYTVNNFVCPFNKIK